MDQKEAIRRTRELALQFPEGSPERAALRRAARDAELGKRISTSTLPAATSLVASVGVARGLLAMVLESHDPIEIKRASREAFEFLDAALSSASSRIASAPPRAEPPEVE